MVAIMLRNNLHCDGFLRIELGSILTSKFTYLFSDLYPEPTPHLTGGWCLASGFSEWCSLDSRAISLGWDWAVMADRAGLTLVRMGLPRSNIMLVDGQGHDHGWLESLKILTTVIDAIPWQGEAWRKFPSLSTA